jgi:hypothetical protein
MKIPQYSVFIKKVLECKNLLELREIVGKINDFNKTNSIRSSSDDFKKLETIVGLMKIKLKNKQGVNESKNFMISESQLKTIVSENRINKWVFDYLTQINKDGLFKACVSPCAYFFKNKKIEFTNNFDNNDNVNNWGSGSDVIFIMDNLLGNSNDKSLVLLENILVNFESHPNSISIKNNYDVIQLTKKGMLYGKDKHSKISHMRMI